MNCPNCGTNNLDNSTLCINCGRPLTVPPPPPPAQTYTPPPRTEYIPPPPGMGPTGVPGAKPPGGGAALFYLIASIPLICCCNPLMIVPMVFGIMTLSRRGAGDLTGMASNARLTAIWFWIAFVIGIVGWGWVIGIGGWDVFEEIRNNLPR